MDVRVELVDGRRCSFPSGAWHDLHHADGAGRALRILVEPRFLVAQRHHEQWSRSYRAASSGRSRHLLELLQLARTGEVPEEGIREEVDLVKAACE